MTEENDTLNEKNQNVETFASEPFLNEEPTPVPQLSLGQMIKQKREEKGLSLKVISHQTKIHIGLLEYLEADQFEKLPSKAYVRGFIKSTSKILGLNYEMCLGLLDLAYAKNAPKLTTVLPNQEMKTEQARNTLTSMVSTPLDTVKSVTASSGLFILKGIVLIVIVAVAGINIKNYVQRASDDSEVKLPEVLTTLHRKKILAPKPVPKPVETEPAKEEPIEINIIQDKNQKSAVTVKDINLQTISLGEKQFAEDTSITEAEKDELLPAKYRIQPTKGMETVFINATEGDSWLTYKVDDKEIKKYVLRQGRTLFLRGTVVRLFLGNTRSLKVFYNNKLLNLAINNKSGVKNLVFPEELKTKYMAPLFVFQDDGTVLTSDDFLTANSGKEKLPGTTPSTPVVAPVKPVPAKKVP
ncbi:MAG: helix-turn-helix domain-containing protein [Bdellovibrionales bacterium]|nr:helix-turn-helix domain-containing protein [Bdellovibrionales bacterium]